MEIEVRQKQISKRITQTNMCRSDGEYIDRVDVLPMLREYLKEGYQYQITTLFGDGLIRSAATFTTEDIAAIDNIEFGRDYVFDGDAEYEPGEEHRDHNPSDFIRIVYLYEIKK